MRYFSQFSVICLVMVIQAMVWVSGLQAESLGDLQRLARENREAIKSYEIDLAIQNESVRKAKGELLPSLDVYYTMNRLNHTGISGDLPENDTLQAGVSWTAFDGFKNYYDLEAAKTMTGYKRFMLQSATRDIYLNVALKFLGVYKSLENQKVAENEVSLYRDRLRQVELKYQVGVLKKSDVLKIKVELDNALQQERSAKADVITSMNLLSFETGADLDLSRLEFNMFSTLPTLGSYKDYEASLLENRSELNAMRVSLKAAGLNVKSSKSAFYPQADLSLTYNSYNQGDYFISSLENTSDEVKLKATLSMNLFDGMKKQAEVNQALLEEKKVSYSIAELERELRVSLKNTLVGYGVAVENLAVAESGTKEAEENLRVTDLSFDQGIATSSDVLDAILNLSRARFNRISARTDVFSADFALKRLLETGDPGNH